MPNIESSWIAFDDGTAMDGLGAVRGGLAIGTDVALVGGGLAAFVDAVGAQGYFSIAGDA
jgi:hypothetical protein